MINEEKILEIEIFLTAHYDYVNDLQCCQSEHYKKLEVFHFLPGHRTLILSIPDQIQQMLRAESATHAATPQNSAESHSLNTLKTQRIHERTDEELKSNLINNLINYAEKNGYQFPDGIISERNMHGFERGLNHGLNVDNYICKCRFSCPFCEKIFPLKFKSFWMSSNVTAHMKKDHFLTEQ